MDIIVVGCGRVGSHLATLLSEDGHNVSVVDRDAESARNLGRDFNGRFIRGIGFNEGALKEAGIEDADVIAAVTSNDNANLMIAEISRRIYEVPHVITRLYEARREKTYMQLGIDYACGTTLVAEEIFSKIQSGHGHHIDTVGGYEIARFAFNFDDGDTMLVSDLEQNYDARVVVVEHDDETFLPNWETVLHDGDVAVVCVAREDYERLSRFIRS